MSGYLQRLATAARNPGGSIHPLLGSVFSPARPIETEESPVGEEEIASPAARRSAEPISPDRLSPETHFKPLVTATQATLSSDVINNTEVEVPSRAEVPKALVPEIPVAQTKAVRVPESGEPSKTAPAAGDRPKVDSGYQPIVARSNFERFAMADLARSRPDQVPPQSRRTEISRRDEVQIHIGRIEVTAVPPAPDRPAPRSPRKALDLGEYLKRGDRRA